MRSQHTPRLSFFSNLAQQKAILEVAIDLSTLVAMPAFLPISGIAHIGRKLAYTLSATRRIHAVHHEVEKVPVSPGGTPALMANCREPQMVRSPNKAKITNTDVNKPTHRADYEARETQQM